MGGAYLLLAGLLTVAWRSTRRKWQLGLAVIALLPVLAIVLTSFEGGHFVPAGLALSVAAFTEPRQWLSGA